MVNTSTYTDIVGKHYGIGKQIGEGSFGIVFEGINLLNHQQVAIKFELHKSKAAQLRNEYRMYKALIGCGKLFRLCYQSFPHRLFERIEALPLCGRLHWHTSIRANHNVQ
jgi:serine/threonine protein kinase